MRGGKCAIRPGYHEGEQALLFKKFSQGDSSTTRRVGIVALTASAMEEDRQRCFAAGMDGHLMKPLDPEKLREVLEQWVRRRGEIG